MSKAERKIYLLCIALILSASALQMMDHVGYLDFSANTLIFFLYALVILLWLKNMNGRLLQNSLREKFKYIALFLIGYIGIHTLKYDIFLVGSTGYHLARYSYYFFTLNIALLIFSIALHVGKSEHEELDRRWKLLYLPVTATIVMILTNNRHHLFFRPDLHGISRYRLFFFIAVGLIGIFMLSALVHTVILSLENNRRLTAIPPLAIMIIWAIYTGLYIIDWPAFLTFRIAFPSTEFNILIILAFIESLVLMRLLPSNRDYESFWSLSALNMGIMDQAGHIVLKTGGPRVSPGQVESAAEKPLHLDQDTLLDSAPISGGRAFWFIDLTDFNALKAQLLNLQESIHSENVLLAAENKLQEDLARVQEQEALRKILQEKLQPAFEQLEPIISHLPEDEAAFEEAFKRAAVVQVFIKRYSNLFLMAKNKDTLPLSEVRLAFLESLEYVKLNDIDTCLHWQATDTIDARKGLDLYGVFQIILENYLPLMRAIFIDVGESAETLHLSIQLDAKRISSLLTLLEGQMENEGLIIEEKPMTGSIRWDVYLKKEQGL